MKQNIIVSSGFLVLIFAVVAGVMWYKNNYKSVDSFGACVKAGYAVSEGPPRSCQAGAKNFVEDEAQ